MKFKKITKSVYIQPETDWLIYKDNDAEGSNKWVINHSQYYKICRFIEAGNDQLWNTKYEATEALEDYLKQQI